MANLTGECFSIVVDSVANCYQFLSLALFVLLVNHSPPPPNCSPSPSLNHTLTHSHTHSLTHTLTNSLTTYQHTSSLTCTLIHSHTLTHIHCSFIHSHSLTHSHTHSSLDAYIDVDATRTESVAYGCSREMNIREHDSQLVLELTRSGNTQTEATVTCLTQGDTATNNVDFEQTEETVTFAPFETRTRCTVEIYDDSIYEGKERFYVYVRSRAGQLVNSTLEETPLCIYIVYDPNDGM